MEDIKSKLKSNLNIGYFNIVICIFETEIQLPVKVFEDEYVNDELNKIGK